jgi:hypothetical protein
MTVMIFISKKEIEREKRIEKERIERHKQEIKLLFKKLADEIAGIINEAIKEQEDGKI